ncbi:amino acid ABC transporter permease [Macrococcoides caseolyticum]|uniref:amino acid ABC transporter permease n=1 Tax=Macrococcoides caseolyticum TaxID=69966 RepID=UPI000C32EC02|nr:amino acid ABC transporter permease [Macrococcus caseolyticus]PKD97439.1 amino acid ABC transporter permease [Macrococcus caseolyticus]PKF18110.1 amino acid ABC transporter permease [Macrococcus caseolyticus]
MKSIQLVGPIRYLAYILVAIQGILFLLLATFNLGQEYNRSWDSIESNANGYHFYINNISIDKSDEILNIFNRYSNLVFIKSMDSDESNQKIIGVIGNSNNFPEIYTFNKKVVSTSDVHNLLKSTNSDATIGLYNGTANQIKSLSNPYFSTSHSIVKMNNYIDKTKSINGKYTVYGLKNKNQLHTFVQDLMAVTGQSKKSIESPNGGSYKTNNFIPLVLSCFLLINFVSLLVIFLSIAVSNLKNNGNLILLGWSKLRIGKKIFIQFFLLSIILTPILSIIFWYISGWSKVSLKVLSHYFMNSIFNIISVFIIILFVCLIVFSMKSIDAIKGKIPNKTLYGVGILGYLFLSSALVAGSIYLDSPMKDVNKYIKISNQWKSVENYYTLKDVQTGSDQSSVIGLSNELNQDFYDWYSSMYQDKNVYISTSEYISKNLLKTYKENRTYDYIPKKPFWYMTFSPTYLKEQGIDIDKKLLAASNSGKKVYLIPDNYTQNEKESLSQWLKESETKNIKDNDISTVFNKSKEFIFVSYHYNKKVFNWSRDTEKNIMVSNPIIYIVTPQNMNYQQSESLRSNDLNGYIKFKDKETAKKYTNKDYLKKYGLEDNKIKFVAIKDFIDGLQKDLSQTILWFLGVIIGIILLSIILLISLSYVYRVSNNERLYVSKFLGFNFFKMYKVPMILIIVVWIIEMVLVCLFHSKIGVILVIIYGIIQILIFYLYMSKNDIKQLLLSIKER